MLLLMVPLKSLDLKELPWANFLNFKEIKKNPVQSTGFFYLIGCKTVGKYYRHKILRYCLYL